ncbi:MAG: GNAT family N-acetyltransferase [Cyanophyceae cyanobacterium]
MSDPQPPSTETRYTLEWVRHMNQVTPHEWNALAKPLTTPFLEWEWLNNLETSDSAVPSEGWLPTHLTVRRDDQLVAAAPLYLKGHSYGEFVFDQQWADLSYRLGVEYYPKMLGMAPFTPAEGYRFLIDSSEDENTMTEVMVSEIDRFCTKNRVSGCHFLFVDPQWQTVLENSGFRAWRHHSYVWTNQNYESFDDYLKRFNANQRRNIKRECKSMAKAGIRFEVLTGDQIPSSYFPIIHGFYASTCNKFWGGSKYLTAQFFKQLEADFSQRVVLFVAYAEGDSQPLGMSFCLWKDDRLYGRYWGCRYDVDNLHFNACYYEPIKWAIANGIKTFDPGAGGKHKRRRGFPAVANHSLHRFYHSRLSMILNQYIGQVNELEQEEIEAINQDIPFSKTAPNLNDMMLDGSNLANQET